MITGFLPVAMVVQPALHFALQNCTNVSCLRITCLIGRLDQRQSAVVKIRSRLWVQTFLQVRISLSSTLSFFSQDNVTVERLS